ncbi:MAG: alpha/beta fold hydrolase [Candidatus Dormibacteraeota bacterium]|nr:alpha/beta fold hydrolase [Candidatus Dormibacteraeota bacterium]
MPVFELPLDELRNYLGSSPRPADFDEYWAAGISELASTPACVELRPAAFHVPFAECFDMYFSGVQGARIHSLYARPTSRPAAHPAVLKFHGYGANAGDWSDLLPYVAAGYSAAAMDCRGQGGPSDDVGGVRGPTLHGHIIRGLVDGREKLLLRQIYLDTVQLVRVVMTFSEVDPDRIGVTGASQGGGLAIACAGLEPRVRLVAPIYPFLSDYRRVWHMDLARDAYLELSQFFRSFDPLHEREAETFHRLGYVDVQFLAERIQAPVLFTLAMMDTVCPPSTQFAAYNRIRSAKQLVVYPDFGHEELPGSADRILTFFMGFMDGDAKMRAVVP